MPIDLPKDQRCHAGAGYPRGASADGQWLLFQHGCYGNELIRFDGTGRQALGMESVLLLDGLAVGNAPDAQKPQPLQVLRLSDTKRWTVDGVRLQPQAIAVPGRAGLLQNDEEGRLVLVDLEAKSVRVLEAGARVSPFVAVTPDGSTGLYVTTTSEGCAMHQVQLTSGKRQRLAQVEGAKQCFFRPVGNSRAVLYAWRATSKDDAQALVASVDLKTGAVKRLGPELRAVGNLTTFNGGYALTAGSMLLLGTP